MAEDDKNQLIKRFTELASRAERIGAPQGSRFLNLAEQSLLSSLRLPAPYITMGGYPEAERRIAVFGLNGEGECEYASPIVCVAIKPVSQRFADELTHRDFLGSLMALGITRDVLGDIIVLDNTGCLFCLDRIADYVIENLKEVKRTAVECAGRAALKNRVYTDEITVPEPEGSYRRITAASERLDAVISAVYRLSREDAKLLVEKGLVYIDGRLVIKGGASVPANSRVTVRGRGRFNYLGPERETKKGKLRVLVAKY